MKNCLTYSILLVAAAFAGGCSDDDLIVEPEMPVVGDGSPFQLAVDAYQDSSHGDSRAAQPSGNPEPENEAERTIKNFWLYAFDASGNSVGAGKYYEQTATEASFSDVTQRAYNDLNASYSGRTLTLYVVTNVGAGNWAKGTDFSTLAKVRNMQLANPRPICVGTDEVLIPMSGQADNVTVTDKSLIVVPVTRMFAKVKVQAIFAEQGLRVYDVNVSNIPWFCQTATVAVEPAGGQGEPAAYSYPSDMYFTSRAFTSTAAVEDATGSWLTLYVPEVILGEIQDADKVEGTNIPAKPLTIDIKAKSDDRETGTGLDYYFKIYPGGNNVNNFNVERNCVYRVTADVLNARDQHNPSANCYIVKPNGIVAFEPYNRDETGGGYDFTQYLNPNVQDKKIHRLEIIWQTKDCIGDNTNGDLVYLGPPTNPARDQKIYVKTNKEGNALVGAYNSSGKIIWSWHIWVTPLEPDNLGNAIVYTTYPWDKSGIHSDTRIPGQAIMACNIGALAFRSDDDMVSNIIGRDNNWPYEYIYGTEQIMYSFVQGVKFPESQIRTFGMMYQWGRKDPFPPMICSTGTEDGNGTLDYLNRYTETHYRNDNRTVADKTDDTGSTKLFHSMNGPVKVQITIQNPTVYIIGTNWCTPNDNKLWGGLNPTEGLTSLSVGDGIKIYDNYGSKSIFDPCPRGWRVPPGDLWMSFTRTGKNPEKGYYDRDVNYCEAECGHRPGLSMYVQAWRRGPTVYFPMQGTRLGGQKGYFKNVGLCGNYHNATCVDNTRVNIMHFHRNMAVVANDYINKKLMLFKVFETTEGYTYKSTGSPVRCVRETR